MSGGGIVLSASKVLNVYDADSKPVAYLSMSLFTSVITVSHGWNPNSSCCITVHIIESLGSILLKHKMKQFMSRKISYLDTLLKFNVYIRI